MAPISLDVGGGDKEVELAERRCGSGAESQLQRSLLSRDNTGGLFNYSPRRREEAPSVPGAAVGVKLKSPR